MIVTNFTSYVPKVENKTLTIKDIFNTLVEHQKCVFNPNNLFDTIDLSKNTYHITRIKKIDNFNTFGLSKRIDSIYQYTKASITKNQFYVLFLVDGTLTIDVYSKTKNHE